MKIPTRGSFYDPQTSRSSTNIPESFSSYARFLGLSLANTNEYLFDEDSDGYFQQWERNSLFQEASALNPSPFESNDISGAEAAPEGDIVRGAEAAPRGGAIRRPEAVPEEDTARGAEAAPQGGTIRRPEAVPEEDTARGAEAAPQGGAIRRPEATPADSKRQIMLGSELQGDKETFKLKCRIKTLEGTFQNFFKKMMREPRVQANPDLHAIFDKILSDETKFMKSFTANLRSSFAMTDLELYDKLLAKDSQAINKLRHKTFKFEIQVPKSQENENIKILLKNKNNSLIELYPISSSEFTIHRSKHANYDYPVRTLVGRTAEVMKLSIGMK